MDRTKKIIEKYARLAYFEYVNALRTSRDVTRIRRARDCWKVWNEMLKEVDAK